MEDGRCDNEDWYIDMQYSSSMKNSPSFTCNNLAVDNGNNYTITPKRIRIIILLPFQSRFTTIYSLKWKEYAMDSIGRWYKGRRIYFIR